MAITAASIPKTERSSGIWWQNFAVVVALILTVLLLVPFSPIMPVVDIDASWVYGINEAMARHMVFGRDIIFTFGPLASVYTRAYHPFVDHVMVGFSIFFAVALFCGILSIAKKQNVLFALIYPLCVSQSMLFDGVFITLPVIFLVVVVQRFTGKGKSGFLDNAAIALMFTAVSILPLVKGSFTGAVIVCGFSALFIVARRSIPLALGMAVYGALAMLGVWVSLGQPANALLHFFSAQGPIISGYTEGMSVPGDRTEIVPYALGALILAGTFAWLAVRTYGLNGAVMSLAVAAILFIGFKMGFIRHYGHSQLAAALIMILSYVTVIAFGMRRAAVGAVAGLAVWFYIMPHYQLSDPYNIAVRFASHTTLSARGLWNRVAHHDALLSEFTAKNKLIREASPLPPTTGTVDVYPSDLSSVLANGQRWSPRPILQSYSAYTPELSRANAAHLENPGAPDRIYFDISPIDDHYPSMEDGESWKVVMERYRVVGNAAHFVVLDRLARTETISKRPLGEQVATTGNAVTIPGGLGPIWAEIDLRPTFLGRLFSMLFKPPQVVMLVGHEDGSQTSYRFIPAVGRSGFLLSPTISSRQDFEAFMKGASLGSGNRVTSIAISGEAGSRHLWGSTYSVSLYSMTGPSIGSGQPSGTR